MESWSLLENLVAAASLVAIAGAVFAFLRWGGKFTNGLRRWLGRFKPTVPRETVRIVPTRDPWWHMGAQGGRPAMQIATHWLVTNVADRSTILTKATMSRGWFRREYDGRVFHDEAIPVDSAVDVLIDFWVIPPFRKVGESFSARLTLVDNLGNLHKTRRITIPSDWRPKAKDIKPSEEAMHAIDDPRVKQVVAILKDEANRYRECGRSVGGLGSVQITYENRTLPGIGYQGRTANSPRRQWIVPDPQTASLHSDNLDALMAIYEKQDENGKEVIVASLLDRIKLGSEYTSIGYFFLLSLFRMGRLEVALTAIKERLLNDKKYGFDDSVKMLSGLLQYEYPNFDDSALDKVELFMEGLNGSLHYLRERCVAARATKLMNS
jgi:hypothetical protein